MECLLCATVNAARPISSTAAKARSYWSYRHGAPRRILSPVGRGQSADLLVRLGAILLTFLLRQQIDHEPPDAQAGRRIVAQAVDSSDESFVLVLPVHVQRHVAHVPREIRELIAQQGRTFERTRLRVWQTRWRLTRPHRLGQGACEKTGCGDNAQAHGLVMACGKSHGTCPNARPSAGADPSLESPAPPTCRGPANGKRRGVCATDPPVDDGQHTHLVSSGACGRAMCAPREQPAQHCINERTQGRRYHHTSIEIIIGRQACWWALGLDKEFGDGSMLHCSASGGTTPNPEFA